MRLSKFRIPAAILAFVLFSMAACQLLEAQSEPEYKPSCHGTSEPSPEPKSDSGIKYCCETGLIPNTNKTPIYSNSGIVLEKIKISEELYQPIFSFHVSFSSHKEPTRPSLISPLRI